jgi:undecaprenyl-diphosphatase
MLSNGLHILEHGGRSFSFFSAHAANAFGLATSTVIGLRLDERLFPSDAKSDSWGRCYIVWMYTWAALVAISRIFVARHYLGDVIVGTIVGLLAGFTFASLARNIIRRYSI